MNFSVMKLKMQRKKYYQIKEVDLLRNLFHVRHTHHAISTCSHSQHRRYRLQSDRQLAPTVLASQILANVNCNPIDKQSWFDRARRPTKL